MDKCVSGFEFILLFIFHAILYFGASIGNILLPCFFSLAQERYGNQCLSSPIHFYLSLFVYHVLIIYYCPLYLFLCSQLNELTLLGRHLSLQHAYGLGTLKNSIRITIITIRFAIHTKFVSSIRAILLLSLLFFFIFPEIFVKIVFSTCFAIVLTPLLTYSNDTFPTLCFRCLAPSLSSLRTAHSRTPLAQAVDRVAGAVGRDQYARRAAAGVRARVRVVRVFLMNEFEFYMSGGEIRRYMLREVVGVVLVFLMSANSEKTERKDGLCG
jgi:hypothetical protein